MTALQIAEAPTEPSAEIYTVTPAVAKRWLSRNVRNRNIRPSTVAAYARDMSAGRWQITGEAVKFDTNGALADGQHRLAAVIKSNTSVPMLVIRGIAPDAQRVMDSGVKRSAIDALSLARRKNPSVLAAAARFALTEPGAGFVTEKVRTVTNSEISEFVEDNSEALTAAAEIAQHYYPAIDCPPSVLAVAWMNLHNVDPTAAGEFYSTIADCQTDGTGDPRLALIRRLSTIRKNSERVTQAAYLSLVFRAWNAWRAGQRIKNLPTHMGNEMVRIPARLR